MQSFVRFLFSCAIVLFAPGLRGQEKFPFQNPDLPVEQRVDDLVSRMTLEEKAMQLFNEAPAIERLGIPAYNYWNECLHGVARAGKATVFPQAIGLAATFDEKLMHQLSTAISDEARAKHHNFLRNNERGIYMGLTFWTPNINIFRDPRWGRGQETYGEDPFLTGRMAVNFIKGLQGDDAKYFKTVATAKHYAVHSGPEYSRHIDNIFVNDRDLYETYLPAFRASVKEARVQSVMCAYNRFRDQPCCGSDLLLGNILRNEFGFDGYVVSDCGAVSDLYQKGHHHVVETPAQAWGWTLASGTDLNCEETRSYLRKVNIDSAVTAGVINEKDMNTSLKRLFTARMKLGMFDPEERVAFSRIPMDVVGSKKHLQLALEAAEKSLVLLKNNGILPLQKGKRVAVIGPNADNFSVLIGNYNGDPIRPVTPLEGLRERAGAGILFAPGTPLVPGVYTNYEIVPANVLFHDEKGKLVAGLAAEYFGSPDFTDVKLARTDKVVDFYWERTPTTGQLDDSFSVRWKGTLVPLAAGTYRFGGTVKVKIDGRETGESEVKLEKGKKYALEVLHQVKRAWHSNNINYQQAKFSWVNTSRDWRKEALDAARKADVVIFCGGISADVEGEEMPLKTDGFAHGDRTHINLPKVQEDLLKEIFAVNKQLVYVNFSGSAMALNWQQENLPAIVQGFYPGEATGTALARLLYGDFNPSGRLPVTFYKGVDELPDFLDYRMDGRTYRYFRGAVLYPFGFGLSYTTFKYANLVVPSTLPAGQEVKCSVDVTNNGKMDGEEVVQIYVRDTDASVPVPVHELVAFQRVFLRKGETKTVTFTLTADKFSLIDQAYNRVVEPGRFVISAGGGQPVKATPFVTTEMTLTGNKFTVKE